MVFLDGMELSQTRTIVVGSGVYGVTHWCHANHGRNFRSLTCLRSDDLLNASIFYTSPDDKEVYAFNSFTLPFTLSPGALIIAASVGTDVGVTFVNPSELQSTSHVVVSLPATAVVRRVTSVTPFANNTATAITVCVADDDANPTSVGVFVVVVEHVNGEPQGRVIPVIPMKAGESLLTAVAFPLTNCMERRSTGASGT